MAHKSPTGTSDRMAFAQWQEAKKDRETWERMFQPVEAKMLAQYGKPLEAQSYFKRMIGDIESGYGDLGANVRRTLAGRYQYGSGYEGEAAKNIGLSKAKTRAGAYQTGEETRQAGLLNMIGLGRGLKEMSMTGANAANLAALQASNIKSNRDIARMQGIGGGCCWTLAMGDSLTDEVREFRDIFFPKDSVIGKGYKLASSVVVPLMKRSRIITTIKQIICLNPLKACADYHFGKNEHGYRWAPVCFWWIGLWVIIGSTLGQIIDVESIDVEFSDRSLFA